MKFRYTKVSLATLVFIFASAWCGSVAHAHGDESHDGLDLNQGSGSEGHHALVHPFMAHMGMPDGPGEVSARVTAVQERMSGESKGTYAFHIESGVVDRVGIHLRNDSIGTNPASELMLQYAVFRTPSKLSGISVFGELEFPTGPVESNRTAGLFGISGAYLLVPLLALNSTIHYNPRDKMTDWEISLVSRLTKNIFPVVEARGEITKTNSSTSLLAALKYKLPRDTAIGVGYQFPVTAVREYDSQLLLQAELGFE